MLKTGFFCALTGATALTSAAAVAQSAFELDEAVVYSGLIPVEVNRTGAAVNVIDSEELEASPLNLEDTLDAVPGVSVSSAGGLGTQTSVRLRGLGEPYIGVTLDGIEVTDPTGTQNNFAFGQFLRGLADRIEIAKGPQTAFYGSDAVAGAVRISTWRPDSPGLSYGAGIEAGSFGTVSGNLNLGHLSDDTEIALSLAHIRTDGFSAQTTDDENDGFRQSMVNLRFSRDVSESVSLGVSAFLVNDFLEYDFSTDNFAQTDGQRVGARVFANIQGDRIDHTIAVSTFQVDRDEISDFGPFPFDGERLKIEYLGTTELSGDATLAFGADWTEEEATVGSASSNDASNGAVFGELQYALNQNADAALSLRHDVYSDFDDRTTGRAAAVFRPSAHITVRASFGTGYRAPSLYERFDPFSGDPDLVPEDSIGGEVGIERRFAGRGMVSAAVFRNEVDNLITFNNTTFAYEQNNASATIEGIELAGHWSFGKADVYGNYTYTDASSEGARLNRVPRHDVTLGLSMAVTERIASRIELRHVNDVLDFDTPLDDYTVINAGASYAVSDTTEAYVRIENLLDEDYEAIRGFNTPDRSYFLGLRASF